MHTLGVQGKDDAKGVAAFWVIDSIDYASLKLVDYTTWNIKVVCNADVLRKLRDVLHSRRVVGKDWVRPTDKYISISTNKGHVKDLIALMEDDDEKEWMESLCDDRTFPFIYNGIADRNPNPGYDYKEFRAGKQVAVEFTTHAINF